MNQQEIMLASIGDLEVTRRALIMEIQARDEIIAELRAKYEPEQVEDPAAGNGQVSLLDEVTVP